MCEEKYYTTEKYNGRQKAACAVQSGAKVAWRLFRGADRSRHSRTPATVLRPLVRQFFNRNPSKPRRSLGTVDIARFLQLLKNDPAMNDW